MNDDEKLIPELIEWRQHNSSDFNIDTWTSIEGNIKLAIGYSFLFWPDFIEHDNCIFIKSHFSVDNFMQWTKVDYVKNFAQIESVINHIHIVDLFSDQTEITPDQVIFLGKKLCEIYLAKLTINFPDKHFIVDFNHLDNPNDLTDYQLTFFQPNNEKRVTKYST